MKIANEIYPHVDCVYLSGGIHGVPNWLETFEKADLLLSELWGCPLQILNPAKNPQGLTRAQYMHMDIEFVLRSDAIILLPNWQASAGSRLELEVALACEKTVIYWNADLEYLLRLLPTDSQSLLRNVVNGG